MKAWALKDKKTGALVYQLYATEATALWAVSKFSPHYKTVKVRVTEIKRRKLRKMPTLNKKKYIVHGWFDFDKGGPADHTTKVTAKNESEAEDIADKRFKKKYGTCDVIYAEIN